MFVGFECSHLSVWCLDYGLNSNGTPALGDSCLDLTWDECVAVGLNRLISEPAIFCFDALRTNLMFHPKGPTCFEFAVQALSSTEKGYDLWRPSSITLRFAHQMRYWRPWLLTSGTLHQLARHWMCAVELAPPCGCYVPSAMIRWSDLT